MTRSYAESRDMLAALRASHHEAVRGGKPSLECPATRELRAKMLAREDGSAVREAQDA